MGRKKTSTLTDAELRVMQVLWQRDDATVGEVQQALSRKIPLAYSTVLTTMRILEQKGYINHKKSGRAFVYSAVVDLSEARQKALQNLLRKFFKNSAGQLVLNILEEEKLTASELQDLRKKIKESR